MGEQVGGEGEGRDGFVRNFGGSGGLFDLFFLRKFGLFGKSLLFF